MWRNHLHNVNILFKILSVTETPAGCALMVTTQWIGRVGQIIDLLVPRQSRPTPEQKQEYDDAFHDDLLAMRFVDRRKAMRGEL